MLGFMVNDRAVGLFTAGMKLTHLITVVVTSLGTVMLPRCSHLIGEKKFDEFNAVITKSYHLLMFSAIPLTVGIILLSRPITLCFCGTDFADAIPIVIYTAPTIIFIGLTNIIGIQILYPYGKENLVIISTLVAAIINILLNILLIPTLSELGAAISTLISEFAVLVAQVKLGKSFISFAFFDKQTIRYLSATVVMTIGVLLGLCLDNIWIQVFVGAIVGVILYLAFLFFCKDEILSDLLTFARKRV